MTRGVRAGSPGTLHSGKDPDKEVKTAIAALKAPWGKEPSAGRRPVESWKQALPWCRGWSLDGDPEAWVISQLSLASHVILHKYFSTLQTLSLQDDTSIVLCRRAN